ncbi:MAG: glycosyltransferase family 2 protein [Candidatus Wallbacteria bacterium]|nr:glycosyltransferase family 2 protein [Candidatus Wallbacteria bacterium]
MLTIVIPVYNEEKNLPGLLDGLKSIPQNWEVIIVDDGSTDSSATILKSSGYMVITHPENYGYGAALKTGIRAATSEFVAIMDSDGQHQSTEISKLLEHCRDFDMVVGARRTGSVLLRKPGKFLLAQFADFLTGRKIPDLNSGFRIFKRDFIVKYLPILPDGFSFTTTITLAAFTDGYRVKYVPVDVIPRQGGRSEVLASDALRTFYMVLKMAAFFNPLKVFLPFSLICFTLSAWELLYEIHLKGLFHISGSFTVMSLAGFIFFFFGLIADMLATMRKWR